MSILKKVFIPPQREYVIAALVLIALAFGFVAPKYESALVVVAFVGAMPTLWQSLRALYKRRITIDVFNAFALVIAFATDEIRSAGFIVLMLSFARVLDWYTETKTHDAIAELLKLKPATANRRLPAILK